LRRDAVHDLENHVGIPVEKIKATGKNGWVTLEWTVDWQYQKSLANQRFACRFSYMRAEPCMALLQYFREE
jgi:hypothetical protein